MTAAAAIGGDVHVLVAGNANAKKVCSQAAKLDGVKKGFCLPTNPTLNTVWQSQWLR